MTRNHRSFGQTRWVQVIALAATLAGAVAACSGTPEPLVDGAFTSSNTVNDAARPDATAPALTVLGVGPDAASPGDATSRANSNADGGPGHDFTALGEGATSDAAGDAQAALGLDGAVAALDATSSSGTSCPVTFTVTGAVVDGLVFQQVLLGGDVPALGAGVDADALKMTQASSYPVGTWTASAVLSDGQAVHFRFGMASTGTTPLVTWESSGNSRTIVVSCAAVGLSYVGQYGPPPDAG